MVGEHKVDVSRKGSSTHNLDIFRYDIPGTRYQVPIDTDSARVRSIQQYKLPPSQICMRVFAYVCGVLREEPFYMHTLCTNSGRKYSENFNTNMSIVNIVKISILT